jgi:hypothetical protein
MNKTEQVINAVEELKIARSQQRTLLELTGKKFDYVHESGYDRSTSWFRIVNNINFENDGPKMNDNVILITNAINKAYERQLQLIIKQGEANIAAKLAFIAGAVNDQPEPEVSEFERIFETDNEVEMTRRIEAYGTDRFFTELAEKSPNSIGDIATVYYTLKKIKS